MLADNNIPLQQQDRTSAIVTRTSPSRIVHDTAIASTRGVNYVPSYRVTLALEISRGGRTKTGRERESSTRDLSPLPFFYLTCPLYRSRAPTGRFPFSQDRDPSIAGRKYKIEFQRLFRLAAGARSTDLSHRCEIEGRQMCRGCM